MDTDLDRRTWMQGMALAAAAAAASRARAAAGPHAPPSHVVGVMTGARAVVETLLAEGCRCVYGIPGAQENELWDEMKSRGLPYLLVTHEFSAACMADGYARSLGVPGVLCVVPGPGVTNALTGLGEALLDSVPIVAVVGDIARGPGARPFQVHSLDNVALLKPVCKQVFLTPAVPDIPRAIREAFRLAMAGEPGPVAVVIPYDLLIEKAEVASPPLPPLALPFDPAAFERAVRLLACRDLRVGIYAGLGCMGCPERLIAVAEMLQAPVATSVSGKGAIPETHPLAVGWGYGKHATAAAERVFAGRKLRHEAGVDCVLALGVKYSEVSTGFYSNPQTEHVVHVDAEAGNIGRVMRTTVGVHADCGLFLDGLLSRSPALRREPDPGLAERIGRLKAEDGRRHAAVAAPHGVAPMQLILALRRQLPADALLFTDVTVSEHLAAEAYTVVAPRTYHNPVDNQSMGWSIPAAIGSQKVNPGRAVATLTGDGCLLMSAIEISTAARERLPVKFFILDDGAYEYMQKLQESAYRRTTATVLARLEYAALAQGLGVGYTEIASPGQLDADVRQAICYPGPVLVRVRTDYTGCEVRWVEAVRSRFTDELSAGQKARFLTRIAARELNCWPEASD